MSQMEATYAPLPRAARAESRPGARWDLPFTLVFAMWVLLYCHVHYYVGNFVPGPLGRIPILMLPLLLVVVLQHGSAQVLYWPLMLFTLLHLANVPFAWNEGLAFMGFKQMLLFVIPIMATLAVVNTPGRLLILFKLLLAAIFWYALHGLPQGYVAWHSELGNPDAFGPLGVLAMGFGYFFARSARQPLWRYAGFAAAGVGMVCMVASFARGAFLAAGLVGGTLWLRSPNKLKTTALMIAGLVVLLVSTEFMYPGGGFWAEMKTIQEGTSEGTGAKRWELWTQVAVPAWQMRPLNGVGANNVGVVGTQIIEPGQLTGRYRNPDTLYNRQLHSVYFQLLSEEGLIGVGLWIWMLIDFLRRLRRVRAPAAVAVWNRTGGAGFDLRYITLGLESAMVAFLAGGVFYNQVYRHWFYTLLMFAVLLTQLTQPGRAPRSPAPQTAPPRPAP